MGAGEKGDVVRRTAGASRGGTMGGADGRATGMRVELAAGLGIGLGTGSLGDEGSAVAFTPPAIAAATNTTATIPLMPCSRTPMPVRKMPQTVRCGESVRNAPALRCAGLAIPAGQSQHPWTAALGRSYPK